MAAPNTLNATLNLNANPAMNTVAAATQAMNGLMSAMTNAVKTTRSSILAISRDIKANAQIIQDVQAELKAGKKLTQTRQAQINTAQASNATNAVAYQSLAQNLNNLNQAIGQVTTSYNLSIQHQTALVRQEEARLNVEAKLQEQLNRRITLERVGTFKERRHALAIDHARKLEIENLRFTHHMMEKNSSKVGGFSGLFGGALGNMGNMVDTLLSPFTSQMSVEFSKIFEKKADQNGNLQPSTYDQFIQNVKVKGLGDTLTGRTDMGAKSQSIYDRMVQNGGFLAKFGIGWGKANEKLGAQGFNFGQYTNSKGYDKDQLKQAKFDLFKSKLFDPKNNILTKGAGLMKDAVLGIGKNLIKTGPFAVIGAAAAFAAGAFKTIFKVSKKIVGFFVNAAKSAETIKTLVDLISLPFKIIYTMMAVPLLTSFIPVLKTMVSWIADNKDIIMQIGEAFASIFKTVFTEENMGIVIGLMNKFAEVMAWLGVVISDNMKSINTDSITGFIATTITAIAGIIESILVGVIQFCYSPEGQAFIVSVAEAFGRIIGDLIVLLISMLPILIEVFVVALVGVVEGIFGMVIKMVAGFLDTIDQATGGMLLGFVNGVIGIVNNIIRFVNSIIGVFGQHIDELNKMTSFSSSARVVTNNNVSSTVFTITNNNNFSNNDAVKSILSSGGY